MKRLLAVCLALGCVGSESCSRPQASSDPPSERTAKEAKAGSDAKAKKDEVTLSPEQQETALIQTREAVVSQEPDILRVKGHVAMADNRTWRVGVRAPGLVVVVEAGLGDYVKKDQVLARYHADEVRDQRAVYRSAVSEVERAKSAAAQAKRNLDRAQKLLDLKAGSVQQVELMQQELVTAQAAIQRAQIEVERGRELLEHDLGVPAETTPGRTDDSEDEVPIYAPANGFIIEKNVTIGKAIDTSTVTFVIADLSRLWMLASVRQEDLGKLRVGQAATVTLPGETAARFPGRITNLGQAFDPTTRVMQVRIELSNQNNLLRPEMLASADIPVGGRKPTVVVPSDAVQQVNGQDVVFVRTAPDRFAMRAVHVGEPADGKTPVLEGLKGGEPVVVSSTFILKSLILKSTLESE